MEEPVLSNVTMDIYRGEFTMLYSERIQEDTILAMEDLLTGNPQTYLHLIFHFLLLFTGPGL